MNDTILYMQGNQLVYLLPETFSFLLANTKTRKPCIFRIWNHSAIHWFLLIYSFTFVRIRVWADLYIFLKQSIFAYRPGISYEKLWHDSNLRLTYLGSKPVERHNFLIKDSKNSRWLMETYCFKNQRLLFKCSKPLNNMLSNNE